MQAIQELLKAAIEHHQAKRYGDAESIYEYCCGIAPSDPTPVYLLGSLYLEQGRDAIAAQLLLRAMEACEQKEIKRSEIPNNLGLALRHLGHEDAALNAYKLALQIDPDNIDALANLSGYWVNQGNPSECLRISNELLARDPGNVVGASHRSIALLELGRYEEGFREYRSRYALPSWHQRHYGCPHWEGEYVDTLVVHGEQGLGDEVLFMGWLHSAKLKVGKIVVECAPRLVSLFERSFGVSCYPDEMTLLAAGHKPDAYCPMGTLPVFCQRVHGNYLTPPAKHYDIGLSKPVVGLSWSGGQRKTHAHLRKSGIEHWKPLVRLPANFVSLQYGEAGKGAAILGIQHDQASIDDIDQLSALISACDLVVSVCNTTIHLAGALGVPCIVLTPSKPAWRYGMAGEQMPWYESVKLIRQVGNDWGPVFAEVQNRILALTEKEKRAA